MILITEKQEIDKHYEALRKIEIDLNKQFNGKRGRITCDQYRSQPNSKKNLKGRWIEIEQIRVTSSEIYFKCRAETIKGDFILPLHHPFTANQLEIV